MSPAKRRLLEDRALRDAAKAVVGNNITYIKSEAGRKSLTDRAMTGSLDYVQSVADGALDLAERNKGKLGGGIGIAIAATVGWIFRDDIVAAVTGVIEGLKDGSDGEDDPEPDGEPRNLNDY
jgi:hypothetical protein